MTTPAKSRTAPHAPPAALVGRKALFTALGAIEKAGVRISTLAHEGRARLGTPQAKGPVTRRKAG